MSMAKEPVVIPARPEPPHLVPPPKYVIFSIGPHRYRMEILAKITPVPNQPAQVIPIDGKQRRTRLRVRGDSECLQGNRDI